MANNEPVIDLISDNDDEEDDDDEIMVAVNFKKRDQQPSVKKAPPSKKQSKQQHRRRNSPRRLKKLTLQTTKISSPNRNELQSGLVFEEDIETAAVAAATTSATGSSATASASNYSSSGDEYDDDDKTVCTPENVQSYIQRQNTLKYNKGQRPVLYHDTSFETVPSSIDGVLNHGKTLKCRCRPAQEVQLSYSTGKKDALSKGRPYYHCKQRKCKFFKWAFFSEQMHWYRFGLHNNHTLVHNTGFAADDLMQGKVGDCWFLSALAVVAERPDLITRLFGNNPILNEYGIVEVTLFIDGFWKKVLIDNFLPCIIDRKEESDVERAIKNSLIDTPKNNNDKKIIAVNKNESSNKGNLPSESSSSKYNPYALCEKNVKVLRDTNDFLRQDKYKKDGPLALPRQDNTRQLQRLATTKDLAYSKARGDQLWAPFLEKAYAKSHGCYQAISGGHIAEAFLDLTGAPTLVYRFDSRNFHARSFWSKLMSYHAKRLPMGCGTSTSQVGLIGMHAYSILEVREITNVHFDFFKEKYLQGTLGNVSGFTEFDGTVRLLRIRNPHGKSEWKGEFSDNSPIWEKLLQNKGRTLSSTSSRSKDIQDPMPTKKDDGTFWMDYDSFLMGFSDVDVVLAFQGNHARSFKSNFPAKKSNHRVTRAFEVSLLEPQPGVPSNDTVELFVMGIQKTRRGANRGRNDRKRSYKVCDLGMLVGGKAHEDHDEVQNSTDFSFDTIEGRMFGFKRNGHYRLILDRKKNKSLVVMPISFGHPAATDKDLPFVLRFVSDSPLLIRELPNVPRIDTVIQRFCLEAKVSQNNLYSDDPWFNQEVQGKKRVIFDDDISKQKYGEPAFRVYLVDCLANAGGAAFLYLCVNDELIQRNNLSLDISISVELMCRGMMCRTEDGLLAHETVAKGKKFEAAWRRYACDFSGETKSRLIMVLFQSGQDTEMGTITCKRVNVLGSSKLKENTLAKYLEVKPTSSDASGIVDKYEERGIFNAPKSKVPCNSFAPVVQNAPVATISLVDNSDVVDLELERALELSKKDARGVNHDEPALHAGGNVESDLERAIRASMEEQTLPASSSLQNSCGDESFSQELKEAIKLSLNDQGPHSKVKKNDKQELPVHAIEVSGKNDTKRKNSCEVVEIFEDAQSQTQDCTSKQKPIDLTKKRKLAAEAATRRFQSNKENAKFNLM